MMNSQWKPFIALCWKQYRETRWLSLSVIVMIAMATWWINQGSLASKDLNAVKNQIQEFYILIGVLGGILAVLFFIPLFSIEMERKTWVFLVTKPISLERCGLYRLLIGFLITSILLGISIILFLLGSHRFLSHFEIFRGTFPYFTLFLTYYHYAVLYLIGFGCFFSLISACTNNRIRSFGLAFMSAFAVFCFYEIYPLRFYQQNYLQDARFLDTLGSWIFYGLYVSPKSLLILGSSILLLLALIALRLHQFHRIRLWNWHFAILFLLVDCGIVILAVNVPDFNLILDENPSPQVAQEIRYLTNHFKGEIVAEQYRNNTESTSIGEFIITKEGNLGFVPPDETPEPVRLVIEKYKESKNSTPLLNQSVLQFLPIDSLTPIGVDSQDPAFFRRDCWSTLIAGKAGIITGTNQNRSLSSGTNNLVQSSTTPQIEWIALGHFTLNDPIQITPVKRCIFHVFGPQGMETKQLECVQPGFFSLGELQELFRPIHDEYIQRSNMKTFITMKDLSADANLLGSDIARTRLTGRFTPQNELDQYTDHQLYLLDYYRDRTNRFWPIISCYDFSDPETVIVYSGTTHQDFYPLNEVSPDYFGAHPNSDRFAVDGNRLVHILSNPDFDTIVIFDISQPEQIQEIDRQRYSHWIQFTNWPTSPLPNARHTQIRFDEGRLLIQSEMGTYLYQFEEDFSLKKLARKTNSRLNPSIRDSRVINDHLFVYWEDDTISQYFIGNHSVNQ